MRRWELTWRAQDALDGIQRGRLAEDRQLAAFCFACPTCRELDDDCTCGDDGPIPVLVTL